MTVAVVTGAGSGIGAATAEHLAQQGLFVVAADRDGDALERAIERAGPAGRAIHGVTADVAVGGQVDSVFEEARKHGPVSVLVNNAGTTTISSLHEISETEWQATFAACLTPVVLCSSAALRQMLTSGGGAIVNVASINQRVAAKGLAAYTAAKGAIVALTKQVAVEYGARGIRCNVVSPGWIRTPSTESRLRGPEDEQALLASHASTRLGRPNDVAAAAAYLVSSQAKFINGAELVIDGASSLITGSDVRRTEVSKRSHGNRT